MILTDTGMLVHACRQFYRLPRLSAVCFRTLAAPAECPVGDPEEKTGQKVANTKDDRFIDKVAHATSDLWNEKNMREGRIQGYIADAGPHPRHRRPRRHRLR